MSASRWRWWWPKTATSPRMRSTSSASTTSRLPGGVDSRRRSRPMRRSCTQAVGSNVVERSHFRYGDPEAAFASAPHRSRSKVRYPRNSCTPIECCGRGGRLSRGRRGLRRALELHGPVLAARRDGAGAARCPASKLRHRTCRAIPAAASASSRRCSIRRCAVPCRAQGRRAGEMGRGSPRTSACGRPRRPAASRPSRRRCEPDGRITALAYDQLDDCGGYLRAPEPATFYRMHGCLTGAYDIRHLAGAQSRGADQQNAGRPGARLRRAAGLFRARAADAAHRDRTRARSARGVSPQLHSRRCVSLSGRRGRADRLRRLPACTGAGASSEGGSGAGC